MNKVEKLIYKIGIEEIISSMGYYIKHTSRDNDNMREFQDKLITQSLSEDGDIGFAELTTVYNSYLYEMYGMEKNKKLNLTMKTILVDMMNIFCLASISPVEERSKYVNQIVTLTKKMKKEVLYEDFIEFQRMVYLFEVKDVTISTVIRQVMYIIAYTHHKREIIGIKDGKTPIYQGKIEMYGGKFNTGLEMASFTSCIVHTRGTSSSVIRPSLLKSLYNEVDKSGLAKYKNSILPNIDKIRKVLTVFDGMYFGREYAKNIFKDEEHEGISTDLNPEAFSKLTIVDRELSKGGENVTMGMINILLRGNVLCKPSILMDREFLTPKEGLRITLKDKVDHIQWIEVREIHNSDFPYHLLLINYEVHNKETGENYFREYILDIKDLYLMYWQLATEIDFIVMIITLKVFGVLDELIQTTTNNFDEYLTGLKEMGITDELESEDGELFKEELMRVFGELGETFNDYTIEIPYHWNYHNSKGSSTGEVCGGQRKELKRIERFSRKLPAGHKPSIEAKQLAEKYMINLEDGKTIVDTHMRLTNMK